MAVGLTEENGSDRKVTVSVIRPDRHRAVAILAHGAGGDMNTPLLVDLQRRLAENAIAAVRFNFPYREAGRRSPDRRPTLESCWRAVADWVRENLGAENVFLGGKSMGGRMASYVVADGFPCRGLFFLGYPLHPAGRTGELRKDHLFRVSVPMLFISGTRDALCELDLLRPLIEELGLRATLHLVDGADHDFRVPKSLGQTVPETTEKITQALLRWLDSQLGDS